MSEKEIDPELQEFILRVVEIYEEASNEADSKE
jgi:hypothetical protein